MIPVYIASRTTEHTVQLHDLKLRCDTTGAIKLHYKLFKLFIFLCEKYIRLIFSRLLAVGLQGFLCESKMFSVVCKSVPGAEEQSTCFITVGLFSYVRDIFVYLFVTPIPSIVN